MTNEKLSFSSVNRYLKCAESYRLHYRERLRPSITNASLLWGSAIDNALNVMILKTGDPYKTFYESWDTSSINSKPVKLFNSRLIAYAERDLDTDLLNEKHRLLLKEYARQCGFENNKTVEEHVTEQQAAKKQRAFKQFNPEQQDYLNAVAWCCLETRGFLTLKAYETKVLPRITEVIAVQKEVNLENDEGDSIVGFVDLIAKLDDGNTYILDNKSSYMRYEDDSVKTSPQLGLYSALLNIDKAGFIVYYKNVLKNKVKTCTKCGKISDSNRVKTCAETEGSKRCGGEFTETMTPEIDIQFYLDDINPNLREAVMGNFNTVNTLLKNDVFYKNTDSCQNWFGSRCCYFDTCFNKSDKGLEKV